MKKINSAKKIIIILVLILTLGNSSANASGAPVIDIAAISKDVSQFIKENKDQIQNYIKYTQMAYQTTQTAINTAKNLKNFDIGTLAKSLTGEDIMNVGSAVLANVGSLKTGEINVLNNGSQVVTNLENYLDKTGINEIRKTISTFKDPVNTTPYNADIQKAITQFVRNTSEKTKGKIVNFTLPYIAQKEICSSEKLKDIIKNGEPKNYIKPKPAVENVDIEKLCNTNLNDAKEGPKAQASFIGLAKAGYGGQATRLALADPANTPNGVISNAVATLNDKKERAIDLASKEIESTGLVIGNKVCLDKDGKPIKIDNSDPKKAFCYNQNSSATNSAALTKEKISAAAQSPFQALLAKSDVGINKGLNKAANVANILNTIVGLGQKGVDDAVSGVDNPYAQLASTLSGIKEADEARNKLSAAAEAAEKEYSLGGSSRYTISDVKNTISIYENLRILNTERLNNFAYTYVLLKYSVKNTSQSINSNILDLNRLLNNTSVNAFSGVKLLSGGIKNIKGKIEENIYLAKSSAELTKSFVNLTKEMRELIRQMAINNYKEQQLKKLVREFENSSALPEENLESIKEVMQNTANEKTLANAQSDWEYIPEYQEFINDPASDDSPKALVPTKEEVTGPYTKTNLFNLRIRAYKVFKKTPSYQQIFLNSSNQDLLMLKGFGITNVDGLTPNLPRPSKAISLVDPQESATYSELSFCNKTGVNICDTSFLTRAIGETVSAVNSIAGSGTLNTFIDNIYNTCEDVDLSVENYCASTEGQADTKCATANSKANMISLVRDSCK